MSDPQRDLTPWQPERPRLQDPGRQQAPRRPEFSPVTREKKVGLGWLPRFFAIFAIVLFLLFVVLLSIPLVLNAARSLVEFMSEPPGGLVEPDLFRGVIWAAIWAVIIGMLINFARSSSKRK